MDLWLQIPILLVTGVGVAALNAVAGGGSYFAFPLLILMGLSPIDANITGKIAIWLGVLSSLKGYAPEIRAESQTQPLRLMWFCLIATVGSIAGSRLLLVTPADRFEAMIPWLMLVATLVFAYGKSLTLWLQQHFSQHRRAAHAACAAQAFVMLLIGLYGGFFGAGMGILVVAFCQLIGMYGVHQANAFKVVITAGITTLSVAVFLLDAPIAWTQAAAIGAGTLLGGYWGARYARHLPANLIRHFIIIYGACITLYFFLRSV